MSEIRAQIASLNVGEFEVLARPHDDVADSGTKAIVMHAGSTEPVGLLVVSSRIDPLATERAVSITEGARSRLGPDIGSVVLSPLAAGRSDGRAYVMWPFHRVLHRSRAANLVRRLGLYPRVLRWLLAVAQQTARVVPESARAEQYTSTLLTIADEAHFSTVMRDAAGRALLKLKMNQWQPYSTLEHNDLWTGNVLLPRNRSAAKQHTRGFIVIDWEGARFEGYPVLDLVRFALSSGMPRAWLRHELVKLRGVLRCEMADLPGYTLAALGAMGQNLGYFPVQRFRELASEAFEAVQTAC